MASSLFGTGAPATAATSSAENSLRTTPNDPARIKALLQRSSNPMSVVQMLASQGNPAAQAAMSYLQNGSTPQQAVMGILQQRGIPLAAMLQNPLFK